MDTPPPAVNEPPEPIENETILEVVWNASKTERTLITEDKIGLFRVYEEHWNTSVPDGYLPYWCRNGPSHFTGDLKSAQSMALLGFTS